MVHVFSQSVRDDQMIRQSLSSKPSDLNNKTPPSDTLLKLSIHLDAWLFHCLYTVHSSRHKAKEFHERDFDPRSKQLWFVSMLRFTVPAVMKTLRNNQISNFRAKTKERLTRVLQKKENNPAYLNTVKRTAIFCDSLARYAGRQIVIYPRRGKSKKGNLEFRRSSVKWLWDRPKSLRIIENGQNHSSSDAALKDRRKPLSRNGDENLNSTCV